MKEFIDYTIFMGMHHKNEKVRVACKNFFIQRMKKTIYMSLENVGKCDDIVWQFDRKTQDNYYPFMDRLHTITNLKRIPYNDKDIETFKKKKFPKSLSTHQKLSLSIALSNNGILYTFDKKLLNVGLEFVRLPDTTKQELSFPKTLETWYNKSLKLRVK